MPKAGSAPMKPRLKTAWIYMLWALTGAPWNPRPTLSMSSASVPPKPQPNSGFCLIRSKDTAHNSVRPVSVTTSLIEPVRARGPRSTVRSGNRPSASSTTAKKAKTEPKSRAGASSRRSRNAMTSQVPAVAASIVRLSAAMMAAKPTTSDATRTVQPITLRRLRISAKVASSAACAPSTLGWPEKPRSR